jgi:hypothetical protein
LSVNFSIFLFSDNAFRCRSFSMNLTPTQIAGGLALPLISASFYFCLKQQPIEPQPLPVEFSPQIEIKAALPASPPLPVPPKSATDDIRACIVSSPNTSEWIDTLSGSSSILEAWTNYGGVSRPRRVNGPVCPQTGKPIPKAAPKAEPVPSDPNLLPIIAEINRQFPDTDPCIRQAYLMQVLGEIPSYNQKQLETTGYIMWCSQQANFDLRMKEEGFNDHFFTYYYAKPNTEIPAGRYVMVQTTAGLFHGVCLKGFNSSAKTTLELGVFRYQNKERTRVDFSTQVVHYDGSDLSCTPSRVVYFAFNKASKAKLPRR